MEAGFAYLLADPHDPDPSRRRRLRRQRHDTTNTDEGSLSPLSPPTLLHPPPSTSSGRPATAAAPPHPPPSPSAAGGWHPSQSSPVTTPTTPASPQPPPSQQQHAKSPFWSARGDSVVGGSSSLGVSHGNNNNNNHNNMMEAAFVAPPIDPYLLKQMVLRRELSGPNASLADEILPSPASSPYEVRHGKRYLRDVPYLLPCDLTELHRQNLRTMLGETVFSRPVCAPLEHQPPGRVLEVGCGSAFWTSSCHSYFKSLGHKQVSFTGFDMAPVAPDLTQQGIDWTFVQHNGQQYPWPFEDGSFDYIMVKDFSLALSVDDSEQLLEECLRILCPGGYLEFWESDHVIRCLSPHNPAVPVGTDEQDAVTATATRTFLITPGMPFAPAQNKFIRNSNAWIELACDKRKLPATPCSLIAMILRNEPDLLGDFGSRRVAIPLTELPWEREQQAELSATSTMTGRKNSRSGPGGRGKHKGGSSILTPEQAAIRHTALITVMQKIESLEPVLKEFSGKNPQEWATWWAAMMADMLDQDGVKTGESLEFGAWWARKK